MKPLDNDAEITKLKRVIQLLESRLESLPDEIRIQSYKEFYDALKDIPGPIYHSELKNKFDEICGKGKLYEGTL